MINTTLRTVSREEIFSNKESDIVDYIENTMLDEMINAVDKQYINKEDLCDILNNRDIDIFTAYVDEYISISELIEKMNIYEFNEDLISYERVLEEFIKEVK